MPFTILKVPKIPTNPHEVLGEFADESEAMLFVEGLPPVNTNDYHDYAVESPPSKSDPSTE